MNYEWQPMINPPPEGVILDLWVRGSYDDVAFYCDMAVKPGGLYWEGRSAGWYLDQGKWIPKGGLGYAMQSVIPMYWKHIQLGPTSG